MRRTCGCSRGRQSHHNLCISRRPGMLPGGLQGREPGLVPGPSTTELVPWRDAGMHRRLLAMARPAKACLVLACVRRTRRTRTGCSRRHCSEPWRAFHSWHMEALPEGIQQVDILLHVKLPPPNRPSLAPSEANRWDSERTARPSPSRPPSKPLRTCQRFVSWLTIV